MNVSSEKNQPYTHGEIMAEIQETKKSVKNALHFSTYLALMGFAISMIAITRSETDAGTKTLYFILAVTMFGLAVFYNLLSRRMER